MPAQSAKQERPMAHPVVLIRAAIVWAHASNIPVRLGSSGWSVYCVSQQSPKWAMYPRASGVCPLGAAILHYQPEAEDPYEAAAECLHAPPWWILAFEAGLNREDFLTEWAAGPDRAHRAEAYEQGIRYRESFIRTRTPVAS